MPTPQHAIDWFEIPVRNLDRAQRFYETLLATTLRREAAGPQKTLAVFGYGDNQVGGCLMAGEGTPDPSPEGTLIYLNAEPSLDAVLARVDAAVGASPHRRSNCPTAWVASRTLPTPRATASAFTPWRESSAPVQA